ncbi:hypothetical protein SAMN05216266_11025 [Amycolatopsis marina]|uniref:Uncharacterized protein n=1 Tax=Amycolatopsis marina TaxID=490629 RepID=A0A1I1AP66_9PSEU|nr:hypothetical protein SAMN05216266_11025 [Amycolatopsis marina]
MTQQTGTNLRQGVDGGWPRCLDRFAELAVK